MSQSSKDTRWWEEPGVVDTVRSYAHLSGLLMQSSAADPTSAVNMSATLRPSKFPRDQYELVASIQPDLQELLYKVSCDEAFIEEAMKNVIKVDEFARCLYQLHLDIKKSITEDKPVVLMCRSDYMLTLPAGHADWTRATEGDVLDALAIKQVEVNTISVSLAGMAGGPIQKLHNFVRSRYEKGTREPNTPACSTFSEALSVAWKAYGNSEAYVLFVMEEEEANSYDQRILEFDLWERNQIKVIRKTFKDLWTEASHGANKELIVNGLEVAVVYYRTAYTPEQYRSDKDWATRLLLESSRAPNCPCVAMQLAGSKRVQQMLTAPGVLERFMSDADRIGKVRRVFAGLFSLAMGAEGDAVIEKALKNPEEFVLKPEREGGGNNFYDADLVKKLETVKDSKTREEFILMEKLRPPKQRSIFLDKKSTKIISADILCEVGVFGVYVRQGDKALVNKTTGALSRAKVDGSKEAGINQSGGKLDVINLVSIQEFIDSISK